MSEDYIKGQINSKESEITKINEDAFSKLASAEKEIEDEFDSRIEKLKAKFDEEV